jgi:hypothetical protein
MMHDLVREPNNFEAVAGHCGGYWSGRSTLELNPKLKRLWSGSSLAVCALWHAALNHTAAVKMSSGSAAMPWARKRAA